MGLSLLWVSRLSRMIVMETTNSLLLAEFYTATGYLDRLIFAFAELEKLHFTPRGKNQIQKVIHDASKFFSAEFPQFSFETVDLEWGQFKNHIKAFHSAVESFIKLPLSADKKENMVVNYINLIYRNCYELHNFLLETTGVEIQYPRVGLIQEESIPTIATQTDFPRAPLFFLDEDKVREYSVQTNQDSPLVFLEMKREEKYDHFIHRGHFYIAQKKYEDAKNCFYKARNYRDTAEVLTLIAWTYSLLDDKSQAKSYCLKAIQHDPQYGPAYNDFGNYILSEGQAEESLRWFELAKRAHNYQNREYPYINAGRAYVLMRNYEQALAEFSLALTIAPHHQELHETVTKLKNNLEKPNDHKIEKAAFRKNPNNFGDENRPETT